MSKDKKVTITGLVRFSYPHVFEPNSMDEGGDPKYGVSLLIPKKDKAQVKRINAAIDQAIKDGKAGKLGRTAKSRLKLPLRDGDEDRPDQPEYNGMYYLNANSKTKPGIVDVDLQPIMDRTDFYAGCWGRASIVFYAFDWKGKKGIAVALNNIQKLKDGEPLSGGTTPDEDFNDDFAEDFVDTGEDHDNDYDEDDELFD